MAVKFYEDSLITIYNGDCRSMAELPDESVHCVVTSPPYGGLRKYAGEQELIWGGNGDNCQHRWSVYAPPRRNRKVSDIVDMTSKEATKTASAFNATGTNFCSLCGAWRGAFGLEPTPELYIQHTIEILREIRRVLRSDGIVWWNIDDSYAGSWGNYGDRAGGQRDKTAESFSRRAWEDNKERPPSSYKQGIIKPLDLCLIPFRVAIAAQEDGWYVRSVAVWAKPNPMPESVRGWTFVRHRVTIEEYEKLSDMRSTKSGNKDRASDLSRMSGVEGEGSKIPLQQEPEGTGDGPCSISKAASAQGKKQTDYRRIKGTRTSTGKKQSTNPRAPCKTEGIPQTLSSDREGEGNKGKEGGQASGLDNDRSAIDSAGMDRGQNSTPLSMFLLQEEDPDSDDRPCDTPEQGGGTYKRKHSAGLPQLQQQEARQNRDALIDCPGCPKCNPNDGYVLRKGAWRPTEAHEYILMLTKTDRYFGDIDAVRENYSPTVRWGGDKYKGAIKGDGKEESAGLDRERSCFPSSGRNLRSIWGFPTAQSKIKHFAVYPEKLPELCIKASTPEVGVCNKCGAPWVRVIEKVAATMNIRVRDAKRGVATPEEGYRATELEIANYGKEELGYAKTIGWKPSCRCGIEDKVPATVLDPFMGSGTTLAVAKKLGRRGVGYEISADYCALALERNRQMGLG